MNELYILNNEDDIEFYIEKITYNLYDIISDFEIAGLDKTAAKLETVLNTFKNVLNINKNINILCKCIVISDMFNISSGDLILETITDIKMLCGIDPEKE